MEWRSSPIMQSVPWTLKSVVCHRGRSIHAGHYYAYTRYSKNDSSSAVWLRLDDLGTPCITQVSNARAPPLPASSVVHMHFPADDSGNGCRPTFGRTLMSRARPCSSYMNWIRTLIQQPWICSRHRTRMPKRRTACSGCVLKLHAASSNSRPNRLMASCSTTRRSKLLHCQGSSHTHTSRGSR